MFETLNVCEDCYYYVCGFTTHELGHDYPIRVIDSFRQDEDKYDFVPEIDEPHFSWSACNQCGSTLGGDRHKISYFAKV